jgi:hypothetical protein
MWRKNIFACNSVILKSETKRLLILSLKLTFQKIKVSFLNIIIWTRKNEEILQIYFHNKTCLFTLTDV